ncbi:unnamed protein product, partial [Durusdinium trenchii]
RNAASSSPPSRLGRWWPRRRAHSTTSGSRTAWNPVQHPAMSALQHQQQPG